MAFSILYHPLAGPTPKSDLKTSLGIKFCTLEVILHAQEVAFGHSGCPLTCKSQFLMIEFFVGYIEIWPLVLLRFNRDPKYARKVQTKGARSLAMAQRCRKWYLKHSWARRRQGHAEQLRKSRKKLLATMYVPFTESLDNKNGREWLPTPPNFNDT